MASTLHRAIQQVLSRGLGDPRLDGALVTVTAVRVSPDLREATVSVSVLPEAREPAAVFGLAAAVKHVRHEVSELVDLRRVPTLHFRADKAAKRQAGVLGQLAKIRAENAGTIPTHILDHPPDNDNHSPSPHQPAAPDQETT